MGSVYEDSIRKMCWSHSRLTAFEHCPYSFYLQYIINDDDLYLSESNFYAQVGSFVHEMLAMIFKGELKPDDALQYYIDNYDKNVLYIVKPLIMDKTFEACADYFAKVDFSWLNDYEIIGVEKKVDFSIKGYPFIGFIDLLLKDKKNGGYVIVDHKSAPYPFRRDGAIKANSRKTFEVYKKQMYLYAHAVKNEYGCFPKLIMWNHFKDGGKLASVPFVPAEYKKAKLWAIKTIHKIENDDEYEAQPDCFYCKNLCNFRNSCEYNPYGAGGGQYE